MNHTDGQRPPGWSGVDLNPRSGNMSTASGNEAFVVSDDAGLDEHETNTHAADHNSDHDGAGAGHHDDLRADRDFDDLEDEEIDTPQKRVMPLPVRIGFGAGALAIVGLIVFSIIGAVQHHGGKPQDVSLPTEEPVHSTRRIAQDAMTETAQPVHAVAPQQETPPPQPQQATQPAVDPDAITSMATDIREIRETIDSNRAAISAIDAKAGAGDAAIAALTSRIAALEVDVLALKAAPPAKAPHADSGHSAPSGRGDAAPPRNHREEAGKGAPERVSERAADRKRHPQQKAAADDDAAIRGCILNGASDGMFESDKRARAWITGEDGEMVAKPVGQTAPCVGRILSIVADDSGWTVAGDKGSLRMPTNAGDR